jgi:glutaconate CoA-transferase, subunit B
VTAHVPTYTRDELLIGAAARELNDGDAVFVGIGLPNRAATLAKQLHAPQAKLIYESGIYGAMPHTFAQSIGDPCLVSNALAVHSMADLFLFYLQGGLIDVGFLGAAQIDRYGNLNSTVIGNYNAPTTRLPGSGGAVEIALLSKRVVVIIRQTLRHFPERLDFVTSPGNMPSRAASRSLAYGRGPVTVVTDMAIFGFDEVTKEMEVRSLHPGVTLAKLRERMGWEPRISEALSETLPPSDAELAAIRTQSLK